MAAAPTAGESHGRALEIDARPGEMLLGDAVGGQLPAGKIVQQRRGPQQHRDALQLVDATRIDESHGFGFVPFTIPYSTSNTWKYNRTPFTKSAVARSRS